jgi:Tol biopolymer transport system component
VTPAVVAAALLVLAAVDSGPEVNVARQQRTGPQTGDVTLDISGDACCLAFVSSARLTPLDTNNVDDVYVLNRRSGRITLESVAVGGGAASGSSEHPRLSHDGRFVVFATGATDVVALRAGESRLQVVRRDRATGCSFLVSRTRSGMPANGNSQAPDLSDDGRFVVFQSTATDLVAGADVNGAGSDIYLFDVQTEAVVRLSLTIAGEQVGTGASWKPVIDARGDHVAFESTAPLDAPHTGPGRPAARQVFLRDLRRGATLRLSRRRDGGLPNGASFQPAISADGRVVDFASAATDLAGTPRLADGVRVFVYAAGPARLTMISGPRRGTADGPSGHPAVSADGRYVVFSSQASNLECGRTCRADAGDLNLVSDIFLADTGLRSVVRVSGSLDSDPWWEASVGPALDASGRVVAFSTRHPIDSADVGHDDDVFIEVLPEAIESRLALSGARATSRRGDPGYPVRAR